MHFFQPLLHWKVCSDCSSTDSPIRVSTAIYSCPNRRIWRAKVQTKSHLRVKEIKFVLSAMSSVTTSSSNKNEKTDPDMHGRLTIMTEFGKILMPRPLKTWEVWQKHLQLMNYLNISINVTNCSWWFKSKFKHDQLSKAGSQLQKVREGIKRLPGWNFTFNL